VRNRVAHGGARVTQPLVARTMRVMGVLTVLPAALFIAGAQVASADTGVAADGRFPYNLGGVVGIVAVIVGVGGLVAGLLRRRRLSATRAAALLDARPANPEPVRSETAA
jgi:hypothetical protein